MLPSKEQLEQFALEHGYYDGLNWFNSRNGKVGEDKMFLIFAKVFRASPDEFEEVMRTWKYDSDAVKVLKKAEAVQNDEQEFVCGLPAKEALAETTESRWHYYRFLVYEDEVLRPDGTSSGIQTISRIFHSPKELITSVFEQMEIGVTSFGMFKSNKDKSLQNSQIYDLLQGVATEYSARGMPYKMKRIEADQISIILSGIKGDAEAEYKKAITESISYDCTIENQFLEVARGLLPFQKDELIIVRAALILEEFIWQVKRKINGHNIQNPFALSIYSNQTAVGKSSFFREKFLSPLVGSVAEPQSLDNLFDQWGSDIYKSFVTMVDEIGEQIDRKNTGKLKSFITAKFLESRRMHSENFRKVPVITSILATTNVSVYEKLIDESAGSARRWLEIDLGEGLLPEQKFKINFDALNNINYTDLWKSVNENNAESPIDREKMRDNILDSILSKRSKTYVEIFMVEKGYLTPDLRTTQGCTNKYSAQEIFRELNSTVTKKQLGFNTSLSIPKFLSSLRLIKIEMSKKNPTALIGLRLILDNPALVDRTDVGEFDDDYEDLF